MALRGLATDGGWRVLVTCSPPGSSKAPRPAGPLSTLGATRVWGDLRAAVEQRRRRAVVASRRTYVGRVRVRPPRHHCGRTR